MFQHIYGTEENIFSRNQSQACGATTNHLRPIIKYVQTANKTFQPIAYAPAEFYVRATYMKPSSRSEQPKLQKENSVLKDLIRALKSENLQLQKKIAKVEAKYLSALNRIKALEHQKDPHGDIRRGEYLRSLTDQQLDEKIRTLLDAKISKP